MIDLNSPWGSTFINNKELLITEKSGSIKLINLNTKKISNINHNLNFLEHGQGGLLDILYKNNFVYISYAENRGDGKTSTSIAKSKINKKDFIFKKYDTENLVNRRSALLTIGKIGIFGVLASRLAYLQIFESDNYKALSDKNRITQRLIKPNRGVIYDIQGLSLIHI